MKSILLASTALVAFTGMAAADGHASITNSMSATLGYNDTVNAQDDNEVGFYWEGNLKTTAAAELDNGLKAGAYFEITVAEDDADANNDGGKADIDVSDFVLSLEATNGGLFFGDTGRAAEKYWKSAGDMEADNVSTGSNSAVIRGDISAGNYKASVSYIVNDAFDDDGADPNDAVEQLSFGAEADFGVVTLTAAYQEATDFIDGSGDFSNDEVIGISAEGTFGGATITVAYAQSEDTTAGTPAVEDDPDTAADETAAATGDGDGLRDATSIGVKVAYPFGPVTATAYYVEEEGTDLPDEDPNYGVKVAYADGPIGATLDFQDDQGTTKIALDASYDVGNGLTMFAGYYTQDNEDGSDYADEYYVAGKYDLGGGASVLVSYAEGEDNGDDEIGADDYQEGTTVELEFSF